MSKTSTAVKRKWNEANYTKISAQLDKELVSRWKEKLKEENVSQADFMRKAIKKYLGENEIAD